MGITFQVSSVERATVPLAIPRAPSVRRLQRWRVEAMGASAAAFLSTNGNGLLAAVHSAYATHYPLAITPDVVWLAIAQGFAQHVNANADPLRGKFVRHQGKHELVVRRDDFVKGSPHNLWPEVFSSFSDAIAEHIGRQRDLVVCNFSTTGPLERAASEIILLEAMDRYFDYVGMTLCGIPEITLEGTVDDWRSIRRRALALEEYELSWWTQALGPVLDQLVETAEGRMSARFWQRLFKHENGSGGPWIGGWINVLFPYLRPATGGALVRNDRLTTWQDDLDSERGGTVVSQIPSGISCAPFRWMFLGHEYPMHFLAGFVGVAQDPGSLAVRPVIGWAVRDAIEENGSQSTEEKAAEVFLSQHAPFNNAGKLVGGWVVEGSWTVLEINALVASVTHLGRSSGVRLTCTLVDPIADSPDLPHRRIPLRLLAGVQVAQTSPNGKLYFSADQLNRALRAARDLPADVCRLLAERLGGALHGEPALYLGGGSLRFASPRSDRSFPVARAAMGPVAVDVSRPAHDARMTMAREMGFDESAIPYLLEGT
jgi:hypothetical protein